MQECIFSRASYSGEIPLVSICLAFKESHRPKCQGVCVYLPIQNLFQGCWQTEVIFQAISWNFPLLFEGEDKNSWNLGCPDPVGAQVFSLETLVFQFISFHFGNV